MFVVVKKEFEYVYSRDCIFISAVGKRKSKVG